MSGLPYCSIQSPSCGACGANTDCDGMDFCCYECGLTYGDGTGEYRAEFIEEVSACDIPCNNYWHGDGKIKPGVTFKCNPCQLPKGHTSDHWTDCEMEARA